MLLQRLKRGSIVILALVIAATLAPAGRAADNHSSRSPEVHEFGSFGEAQAVVPFELSDLPAPAGFTLTSVTVQNTPGDMVIVDATYRSPDRNMISFQQANAQLQPPRSSRGGASSPVEFAGVGGVAIDTQNMSGMPVAVVHWTTGGVTLTLIASNTSAADLVPLAASVRQ